MRGAQRSATTRTSYLLLAQEALLLLQKRRLLLLALFLKPFHTALVQPLRTHGGV